jgi:hypothetical protein
MKGSSNWVRLVDEERVSPTPPWVARRGLVRSVRLRRTASAPRSLIWTVLGQGKVRGIAALDHVIDTSKAEKVGCQFTPDFDTKAQSLSLGTCIVAHFCQATDANAPTYPSMDSNVKSTPLKPNCPIWFPECLF